MEATSSRSQCSTSPLRLVDPANDWCHPSRGQRATVKCGARGTGEEADWLSGVVTSLRQEVEELTRRNAALQAQLSTVDDPICSPVGASFGGLSGLSTAAASKGHDATSHAISWSRLSPQSESRFASERRVLLSRVTKLEAEHRHLEMLKMERLTAKSRIACPASSIAESAAEVVRDVDILSGELHDADAACIAAEREAISKEDKLASLRREAEEWQQLDTPEGRRLVGEFKGLRHDLDKQCRARATIEQRIRETDEASARASSHASTFRSDCGILEGTREALLLEQSSVHERLTVVSTAAFQTRTALAEIHEANAESVHQREAEAKESVRLAEGAEAEVEATIAGLSASCSALSASTEEVATLEQGLADLRPVHAELRHSFGTTKEARKQWLHSEGEECRQGTSANDEYRANLSSNACALQEMRPSYAEHLQQLRTVANAFSAQQAMTAGSCERLRIVIKEMYSHAEALALQLELERKRGKELWKEVAAVAEATRQMKQQQSSRRCRGARASRESGDLETIGAAKASAHNLSEVAFGRRVSTRS